VTQTTDTQDSSPEPPSSGPSNPPSRQAAPVVGAGAERLRKVGPLVVAGAGILASVATGTFPVVAFMLAIVTMVMLHEAGHFVTAKWSGMKVTEFFFGFGPRLWSLRRGETEYGVKALPLGGYVKIIGMSNVEKAVDPGDEHRTYRQQSYPKRVLVAMAGVATHFVIGFVLLLLIWTVIGVPSVSHRIGEISPLAGGASPAREAGLKVGDEIVSVDGHKIAQWDDIPPLIRNRANAPIEFVVRRGGERVTLTAVPSEVERNGTKVGFVGIGPASESRRVGPVVGVGRAADSLGNLTWVSAKALGSFFTLGSLRNYASQLTSSPDPAKSGGTGGSGRGQNPDDGRLLSIVGVTRIAGQAVETGWFNTVYLLVALNIFVALLNMVPLLPFDGGHVAVATYERIRSRSGRRYHADVSKMTPVAAAVMGVLLLMGISALYLDIMRPLSNPFQ